VVVVGAGPAGAATAKTCASGGLRTLLMERERLPRMRVADAAMYKPAQRHVRDAFGEIPARVLSGEPTHLRGGVWHEPVSTQTECLMPWCWRNVLDHWMADVAVDHGADLLQETRFTGFERDDSRYRVHAKRADGSVLEMVARYLVGADGPTSKVRRLVRPVARFDYLQQAQHHYRGELALERDLYHFFLHPEEQGLGKYAVTAKGDLFAVSYAAHPGRLRELIDESFRYLPRFGFHSGMELVWRGNCVEPMIGSELSSHRFRPGRDDILLVGDAGGFHGERDPRGHRSGRPQRSARWAGDPESARVGGAGRRYLLRDDRAGPARVRRGR
jgi:flavin-dependent dehydrogenase